MIVKVKEPQASERLLLRENQILFTYLHLAPDPLQTKELITSKEPSVLLMRRSLIMLGDSHYLRPMSEVAGRMSIQAGAFALEKSRGGRGVLLGGVAGVEAANVVIIGGGVVGANAAQMAIGLNANVTIIDHDINVLRHLDAQFSGRVNTVYSTHDAIEKHVFDADLVIGGVLAGAAAPKLVTKAMVKAMKTGAAIVDVAIDQGGCVETSHATTHDKPTYIVDDVVHYCVANMPGAVARTSTVALNNATLPYIIAIANKGHKQALLDDKHLCNGLNVYRGHITCQSVAQSLSLPYITPAQSDIISTICR